MTTQPRQQTKRSLVVPLCLALALLSPPPGPRAGTQTPAPAPQPVGLAGLRAQVRITRDERGIPHIEAAGDEDLYFAQGYATAADRLWQMDLLRRTARGELAEIFGRAALEEDKRHRTYGFGRLSETLEANAPAETRRVLEAYARGVNAYVEAHDGGEGRKLPQEFQLLGYRPRAWRPADSIIIGKIFAESLSTTWPTDLMRAALADLPADRRSQLLPATSPLDVPVVGTDAPAARPGRSQQRHGTRNTNAVAPDAAVLEEAGKFFEATRRSLERAGLYTEESAVSNNWVVSGKRTATGKPLLANDPHLPPSAPSIWHMAHLKAPGVNVAGVTAPGAPGIIIGHNEHVAWGMTNLGPDVQDLYLEKFSGPQSRTYQTPAGAREAEVRTEEIKVRKSPIGTATETVAHEVTVTRHGPIVTERAGARYSLRWTALDQNANEFVAFYKLNRARNWDEFRAALSEYRGPTQNFIYADTRGHIGYYGAGMIPVRKSGDGSVPYDGSTDAGEWTGFIPFAELPHVFDPPSGLIVTANSRVVGRSYRHHLTHEWASAYRTRRIYDLLKDRTKLTAEDFRAVQGDTYSIGGHVFAREAARLGRAVAPAASADEERQFREALKLLESWDGRVDADSRAAPLASEMRGSFRRRVLVAALGEERARLYNWPNDDDWVDQLVRENPREWLPKEFKDYGELIRASFADARANLVRRLGADEAQWTWGRYSQGRFNHPLASVPLIGQPFQIAPVPLNGSGGTIGPTVNVGAGVSMRLIADTADWDRTQQGIALGVSGDPSSPHWSDQLADWRAVTP
ncbi:MAG TPA: penicillin acylase family protein, partial [Pyrinomonadaceae bacterium]|nr:penicillin acylase family protein [Pyrinomonadaceae bacterium]